MTKLAELHWKIAPIARLVGAAVVIAIATYDFTLPFRQPRHGKQDAHSYAEEVVKAAGVSSRDESLLHRLPGQPCPVGYILVPRAFRRYDETWDGCVWRGGRKSGSIDFLLPQESAPLPVIIIPGEGDEPKEAREKI